MLGVMLDARWTKRRRQRAGSRASVRKLLARKFGLHENLFPREEVVLNNVRLGTSGFFTSASRNSEHDFAIPSYQEMRRIERGG